MPDMGPRSLNKPIRHDEVHRVCGTHRVLRANVCIDMFYNVLKIVRWNTRQEFEITQLRIKFL